MVATIGSQDQPGLDIGAAKRTDPRSIQKNIRTQAQWEHGRPAEPYPQLKEATRIQDKAFVDPVDLLPTVYLIPIS